MDPKYDSPLLHHMTAAVITNSRAVREHAHEAITRATTVRAAAKATVQEVKIHREHLRALRFQLPWLW